MDIKIWEPTADVERIRGLVVVIDVFRAFSTNCYIAEQNPKKLIPFDSIDAAFEMRREYAEHTVLVGERRGIRVDGFAPESDFEYCMALDRFDFVLKRTTDVETGRIELTKCDCSV